MSKIKGYTAEEIARDAKEKLISDYEYCKCDFLYKSQSNF